MPGEPTHRLGLHLGLLPAALAAPLLALSACGFSVPAASAGDGGGEGATTDTSPAVLDLAHVAAADEATLTGTTSWSISSPLQIDTTAGTATPPLPAGVILAKFAQDPTGPMLLVLQAKDIEITSKVTIVGAIPIVFVATGRITLTETGMLEASADHARPGPGGAAASDGPGAGIDGGSNGFGQDAGGSGGSFGTRGGASGAGDAGGLVAAAHDGGPVYGTAELRVLEGGSGGGHPSPLCSVGPRFGGAGGGAIQLSAPALDLRGVINAGGGGGEATDACFANGLSGGGGGGGGAIYLQAFTLSGTGTIAANGGGGAGTADGLGNKGAAGGNGRPDTTPATGGIGQFGDGGDGATTGDGAPGITDDNGGGGGGGAGRIFLDVPPTQAVALTSSPAATRR